jgi:hypothetical protein
MRRPPLTCRTLRAEQQASNPAQIAQANRQGRGAGSNLDAVVKYGNHAGAGLHRRARLNST